MDTVAIVGLGLIGGSFSLAIRKAGFTGRILGVSSPRSVDQALEAGVIDEAGSLESCVERAGLVYLAQPIPSILDTLSRIGPWIRPETLVTDVASTKVEVCARAARALPGGQFAGGHPMAGKEARGIASASADLFVGRTYFLTVSRDTLEGDSKVSEFAAWLVRIGARPIPIDATEHDRLVALTSHLPQLASTALAAALAGAVGESDARTASGPGLVDMTRLSLSAWDIWSGILETNYAPIDRAIGLYIQELEKIRGALGGAGLRDEFKIAENFSKALRKLPD